MNEVETFFAAIVAGDAEQVRSTLDSYPQVLSESGPDGASPALTALYCGHPALADELAARSGDLSVFEAAAFDETGRLEELITANRAIVDSWSADGWQPLHLAAFFGRAEAARALLDADAEPNLPSRNPMAVHPLHAAAAGRHPELVWILIASEAEVDARQHGGWTPLHSAARNGDLESIRALLSAGADPAARNDEGQDSLELAPDDAVRSLLLSGGKPR